MNLGTKLIRCAARGLLAVLRQVPLVGAVVEIAEDMGRLSHELAEEQARHELAERVAQIEQAGAVTPEQAREIARAAIEEYGREHAPVPADRAEAVADIIAAMPARIAERTGATLAQARRRGTAAHTVIPVDPSRASEAERTAFYGDLIPKRRPRFRAGDLVPHGGSRRFEALIGIGGFGEVWRVRDALGRIEAVKFCLNPADGDMLRREAENLKVLHDRLAHEPHIVAVRDLNLDQDPAWLAFEYVDGGTLEAVMRSFGGPLPIADALRFFAGVCRGMAAAHAVGLVHRDLKPANVLVTREGVAKVADFGLGKVSAAGAVAELRSPMVRHC